MSRYSVNAIIVALLSMVSVSMLEAGERRIESAIFEPADGGFVDYLQPGTGLTITKVGENLYYGIFVGYDEDGSQMWRTFLGEFEETQPAEWGVEGVGRIKAATVASYGGQALGGEHKHPTQDDAVEGDIIVRFDSSRQATVDYGGTQFVMNFPQISSSAKFWGRKLGMLDGGGDVVEARISVGGDMTRVRDIEILEPFEIRGTQSTHIISVARESILFKSICEEAADGDGLYVEFNRKSGVGSAGTIKMNTGVSPDGVTHGPRKQLATLVAARDGIVFHGKTCEGLDLEGVILPNRSQMVYFDLTDE